MNFVPDTGPYSEDETIYGGGDSLYDQYESGYESSQFGGGESIGSLDGHCMYGGSREKINQLFETSLFNGDLTVIKQIINEYVYNYVNKSNIPEQYEAFNIFVTNKLNDINDVKDEEKRKNIMKLAVMCYIFTHNVVVNDHDENGLNHEYTVDFSKKTNDRSINIDDITDENIYIENILMKLNEQLKEKSDRAGEEE